MKLILASGSAIRAHLLRSAGVTFEVQTTAVDETALKNAKTHLPTKDLALALAEAKALAVATQARDALVIGADQILALDEQRFDKPTSVEDARQHLNRLRGKTHQLISAVCCAKADKILWSHVAIATLTMRHFSDTFRESYIQTRGNDLLTSVGAYKLESDGIQLFETIDGDYFTILGLPLLPLLHFFRGEGVLMS